MKDIEKRKQMSLKEETFIKLLISFHKNLLFSVLHEHSRGTNLLVTHFMQICTCALFLLMHL